MARWYKNKAGKRVKSVTTIIGSLGWSKNALMYWAVKMVKHGIDPFDYRNKAAELGTLIHSYIEHSIFGSKIPEEEKKDFSFEDIVLAEKGFKEYKEKEAKLGIQWLESELELVSEQYQYGGKLDGLCTIDVSKIDAEVNGLPVVAYLHSLGINNPVILTDTKTSNGLWSDHIIQLGAYDNLLRECTNYKPDGHFIIKVSKDKEAILQDKEMISFIPVPKVMIDKGFEIFKGLIGIEYSKNDFEKQVAGLTEPKIKE